MIYNKYNTVNVYKVFIAKTRFLFDFVASVPSNLKKHQ